MKKGSLAFAAGGLTLAAVVCFSLAAAGRSSGAPQTAHDLTTAAEGRGWTVVNRAVSVVEEEGRKFLRLDERAGDGQVWLDGVSFAAGTIEFDVRGKDVFQRSFVGAAFHGTDDRTFEAVYFRPFNFKADDPARKNHSVQYVSNPDYTWQRLRAEKPGQYENPVSPVPDPNGWFHVRIIVAPPTVSVFVDGAAAPCLTVDALGESLGGKVGLMVGNGSGGDFTGFKLTPSSVAPGAPPRRAPAPVSMNIFQAAQAGNLERVKALVEGDPALADSRNPGGRTPLIIAVAGRQTAVVEYLLSKGADINAADSFQTTPLLMACAAGAPVEIVRLLVEKGADVNSVAKYSGKPLDSALDAGNAEIIAYLEAKGAKATPLDFETHRLAPNVHRIAYPWGMRNNVIVFSGPEGILLLDSGFSEHAVPALRKTIGGLASGDITFLINTHLHGDHVASNAVAPAGAAVLNAKNLDGPDSKGRIIKGGSPFRGT
ncbi:MAG: ankyrin repeat domain-containing protein, partial [Candidatus Aminicenantes bacterium]|nr:ankyrin repeat domain-containing protein [Candidatus Aminicenantes bacterium]